MDATEPKRPWWQKKQNSWPLFAVGLIILLILPLICVGALVVWHGTASAISPSKTVRLHVGMTDKEVLDLLGEPESVFPRDDGGKQWVFSRMTWAAYYIEFDPDGRIIRHWHDY